ncbi:MAG: LysM peptidoglycan-binding domain-containing protein [Clostridiales bacterium]|jgi:spore germination protein YaaH|nr:LysM peptidoglycan-binding domain-containing protein [Clostridiales bacterium]
MFYTIKPGDTIYAIASEYQTTVSEILASNPGLTPYNLIVGQQIIIPAPSRAPDWAGISINEMKLINTLRSLWEQHVAWTRMAIVSAEAGSPDLRFTVDRLLRNPSDMADALRPLYGDQKADTFGRLVYEHLSIALQLVNAAKAGNTQAARDAEQRWYQNADKIAAYLNTINPYINKDDFRRMFHTHLALTKDEAVNRLNRNYARDIALYDRIENQALEMADMMSEGIVRQFPNMFR